MTGLNCPLLRILCCRILVFLPKAAQPRNLHLFPLAKIFEEEDLEDGVAINYGGNEEMKSDDDDKGSEDDSDDNL
eukprot:CAMPEP_0206395246 /NCGR_PEP_ID=MMETSP0294-20121207/21946_1 /ASSEMBLY_ACC=CAM_ASM_000327 /TAXON_ID=39354 /ORGANISM="Heterosigma akashiwo, Strain CCMP2393" /LENGTH=74 /DNA_ID=CAMNT_0053849491 /DNA_START=132 /DNA_END=356 /DNA_ORIENTATION=+